jgi:putative membrane protein
MEENNKIYRRLFIIVSVLIPVVVAVLLYMPKGEIGSANGWISSLPFYNAMINTLTSFLLVMGFFFVKKGHVRYHKVSMISAFILGALFLVFYIIYHSNAASTTFGGTGIIRYVYFFFLITHILLAFIVVPLVLSAIFFAVTQRIAQHRRIVKYTFPVWLYVSVTGVIVYLMISPYYSH